MKKRLIISTICALSLTVPVFGAPQVDLRTYEKDGMKYIEKTYVIDVDEEISDVANGTFELDGYNYFQVDIKSEPIVQTEEKKVEEWKKTSVSAQGSSEIVRKLGETIKYEDEEGFHGELKPDMGSVKYSVSGYTSKTMTKSGSRMFYSLPTMDTSQITKTIWQDGVQLKLVDIRWIGDNRSASGYTAVGNFYAAQGLYKGTYQVNVPSGYTAEVLYKGTAEKEVSEQTAYTVTYVGEEIEPEGVFENIPWPLIAGILLLGAAVVGVSVLVYRRRKQRSSEEMEVNTEEMMEKNMEENMEDEVQEDEA